MNDIEEIDPEISLAIKNEVDKKKLKELKDQRIKDAQERSKNILKAEDEAYKIAMQAEQAIFANKQDGLKYWEEE